MNRPDLDLAGLPRGADHEPTFREPWQAKAFALAVTLNERGMFTWDHWSATFAAEIDAETHGGSDAYWDAWLRALESILGQNEIAGPDDVHGLTRRWQRAAEATPHGTPISLSNAGPEGQRC